MERRLAAILAADIVDYSRQIGADEAGTLARLASVRESVISPLISEHEGRLFKTMGDGFLAEFSSAVRALSCALAIQERLGERNAAADSPMLLRIGLHQGDVVVQDDDLMGDGVNIASRLQGLAEPGGIAMSARVREDAEGRLEIDAEDIGSQRLKNITRPVRVFRIVPAPGTATASVEPSPILADRPSIAVLPFANMSGDTEQEYFADGVTEDIITELSRSQALFVIARNSSFTYRGKTTDITQVGRELGVRYVLEGSVRRSGNRVRVTAQLIEAASGNHLWGERYDREMTDIFAVQDEITRTVVSAIHPALAEAELRRVLRKPPESLDAWDNYQRGLWYMGKYSAADSERAIVQFLRAIEQDPSFVPPYTALVLAYQDSGQIFGTRPFDEALKLAREWARKAYAVNRNDDDVMVALGTVEQLSGRGREALDCADLALEMNPLSARAHGLRGAVLIFNGKPAEGRAAILTAMRLDPRDPRGMFRYNQIAISYYYERDYAAAVEATHRMIARFPESPLPYRWQAAALGQLGRTAEARTALQAAMSMAPQSFEFFVRERVPWHRPEDYAHMLEGLRKAGWDGSGP